MFNKLIQWKAPNMIAGTFLLLALTYYGYNFKQQVDAVSQVCNQYPIGTDISTFKSVTADLPVESHGPLSRDKDHKYYFVCSTYSMCEISCDITTKNNKVVEATLSNVST